MTDDPGQPESPGNDAPSSQDKAPSDSTKRARAGRKASQADAPTKRPRVSSLDPWKKAREKAEREAAASGEGGDERRRTEPARRRTEPARRRTDGPGDRPERRADRRPSDRPDDRRTPRERGPDNRSGDRFRDDRGRDNRGRDGRAPRRRFDGENRRSHDRGTPRRRRSDQPDSKDRPPRREFRSDRGDRPGDRRDGRRHGGDARGRDSRGGDYRDRDRRGGDRPREDRGGSRDDRGFRGRGRAGGRRERQEFGQTHGPREARDGDVKPKDASQIRAGVRLSEVEELELDIEKLVYGGDGLARFEGIPIFVPRAAPGDRLRLRLTERKLGYGRAEIVEIVKPGPGRRQAPCPHYDRCGGCDLQHMDDASQLKHKAAAVVETLRRIGGVKTPERFDIIAGDPFGYRMRTQLHLAQTERGLGVGYFARGSHDLVPVTECPVLVPQIERQLPSLPKLLEDSPHARMDFAAGDDEQWAVAPPHGSLPTGEITVEVGDLTYTYDARCFFQGHRGLVEDLVNQTLGDFEEPSGRAFDLYGGVGLFGLPLSRRYEQVVSVEGDRVAARFARRNAKNNRISNLEVISQSVESWIEQLPKNASRVLVDPPRVGLSDKVRRALMARKPQKLTYVSCEPPTLARDLKEMSRFFRIDSLTLIDMFPQTGHMESVVQLSLPD